MLTFRNPPRRFICSKCGKKSFDVDDGKLKDSEVEIENLDICKRCFKNYRQEMKQTYTLIGLVQTGKVSKDEMELLHKYQSEDNKIEFKKLKIKLLKRSQYKKGDFKEKKKLMILNLKKNTLEMHNRVNFIQEFA